MNKYLLIRSREGVITTQMFPTEDQAWGKMKKEFLAAGARHIDEGEEPFSDNPEYYENDDMVCDKESLSARVWDGDNHDNYSWKIEKIPI